MTNKLPQLARQQLSRFAERLLDDKLRDLDSDFADNPLLRKKVAGLIRDYCSEHLRPEIQRFAGLMELKMLKHDPARGSNWKKGRVADVYTHIQYLVEELSAAVVGQEKLGLKAADIANNLMILADLAGELEDA